MTWWTPQHLQWEGSVAIVLLIWPKLMAVVWNEEWIPTIMKEMFGEAVAQGGLLAAVLVLKYLLCVDEKAIQLVRKNAQLTQSAVSHEIASNCESSQEPLVLEAD